MLKIKDKSDCAFDEISLGEVMLRLDPGDGRIRSARSFSAWEGGGEYNVARGLRKCFGMRTAIVTAFADNDIGRLVEDFIMQGGVDARFVKWTPYDGIGRAARNGLNFTERGFGVRGALGVSDRANTAASQLKPGDIDWDEIFGEYGARWFHTGGIFAALSDSAAALAIEAAKSACRHGVVVSYDLNYRPSLWRDIGGVEKAREVNRELAKYVDVMIGNEEDFSACLGLDTGGASDEEFSKLSADSYMAMMRAASKAYPNLKVIASSLRTVKSASFNDWTAVLQAGGRVIKGMDFSDLLIYDRVGGGDSFASGLIYGLLEGMDAEEALNYGICHGALAMTTPGDTSMATLSEVSRLARGGGARVIR